MKFWSLFILLLLFFSCTSETQIDPPPPVESGEEAELAFKVVIPGVATTKAGLDEQKEIAISEIDVLVFAKAANERDEVFMYKVSPTTIGGSGSVRTFNVKLKVIRENIRLVVLANSSALLSGLTLTEEVTTKGELLDNLIYDATSFDLDDFEGFPMWGQTKDFYDLYNSTPGTIDINLLKAVARIDINNPSSLQTGKFKIIDVHVINAVNKGFVSPPDNTLTIESDTWKVSETHIPTTTDDPGQGVSDLVKAYTVTPGAQYMQRQLYIAENYERGNTEAIAPTSIVLEAKFNNQANSYYRLDFLNGNNNIPIFRNHKYTFQIVDVNVNGYKTKKEAIDATKPSAGIVTLLTVDSDNNLPIHDIVWYDDKWLGVGVSEILFDWDQICVGQQASSSPGNKTFRLPVATEGSGWTYTYESSLNEWLTISQTGGGLDITAKKDNIEGIERQGKITVKAGTQLSIEVNVRQSGGANCHMIRFNGNSPASVRIPLSFARVAGVSGLDAMELGKLKAKVLWTQEVNPAANLVKFEAKIGGTGTISEHYIEVTATTSGSSYYGNAVVALVTGDGIGMVGGSVKEDVLWSWHIWSMPNANDMDKDFHDPNRDGFMQSVLGKTPDPDGNKGMFYQWGRKDPFPDMYTKVTPRVITKETDISLNTLEYVTSKPTVYYHNTNHWLRDGILPEQWKGTEKESKYDPCPTGWRVPSEADEYKWTVGNNQFQNGYISGTSGDWGNISEGRVWLAPFNQGGEAPYWSINGSSGDKTLLGSQNTTMGCSVRCVRDIVLVNGL